MEQIFRYIKSSYFLLLISSFLLVGHLQAQNKSKKQSIHTAYSACQATNEEEKLLYFLKNWPVNQVDESEKEYITFILEKEALLSKSQTITRAELYYHIAKVLYYNDELYKAYEYIDKVNSIIKTKPKKDVYFLGKFYKMKGEFYFNFRDNEEAKESLYKALSTNTLTVSDQVSVYNSLGLVYRNIEIPDSSVYFFNKAIQLAREHKEDSWLGVITGNLGFAYYKSGNYQKALEYLDKDKELSLIHEEYGSALNALALIIQIKLQLNEIDNIENFENIENIARIDDEVEILDSINHYVSSVGNKIEYFSTKAKYYEYKNEYKSALKCYQQMVLYDDSIKHKYNQTRLKNKQFQIQYEKKQIETELLIEKEKRASQLTNAIIIVFLIILIAGIVFIYSYRKRKEVENQILELKNQKIKNQLKDYESELETVLFKIKKKNAEISSLNAEIQRKEKEENSTQIQQEKTKLYDEIQSLRLLTENDLVSFKQLFNKLHPGFYDKLIKKHNSLSKAEARMAMLIQLNLSNLEMSKILGITPDSVRKTNLRLRKKLKIRSVKELKSYIHNLKQEP